jgi:hypothetical protein
MQELSAGSPSDQQEQQSEPGPKDRSSKIEVVGANKNHMHEQLYVPRPQSAVDWGIAPGLNL